ncbi:AAA family ATPase [Ligilactobacillus equi]|uniref:ATP-dependent Clp protease n=2 Tax=Ligilactobacillus equi TaxID=137357 RepID=V7HZX1_9LACO|nr:AAA family ATPase [Ligilactobacillus equi]ETA74571.1 ATP-dependent Clp protease [Ligilactobacillus equi DPC 6820]KRL84353.1 ATP-dependent Clp protease [Ligilactobacillus equi DSM 15833 = JCM 10991]
MQPVEKFEKYPVLKKYLTPLEDLPRPLEGRDAQLKDFIYSIHNPLMNNPCLIGNAGTGKTALVQGAKKYLEPHGYFIYELNIVDMQNDSRPLDSLMRDVMLNLKEIAKEDFANDVKNVIFIDEMHILFKIGEGAAAQAMKKDLAASAELGLIFAFATTNEEYQQYVAQDEAFDTRMNFIRLPELSTKVTVNILNNMVNSNRRLLPSGTQMERNILYKIVTYTDRYVQQNSQPRKSMKILDSMLGRVRGGYIFHEKYNLDTENLAEIMRSKVGVNIRWNLDIPKLKEIMNARVLEQFLATEAVTRRLYLSKLHLNNANRPQGSFLFTGPTGTGKTELAKALTEALFGNENHMIRFDMSEYSEPSTVTKLRERLAQAVWETPHNVILIDEIEKAAPECSRLFLQILDDARLSDRHDRVVSFKDSYIIMTTNVAQEVYKGLGENIGVTKKVNEREMAKKLSDYTKLIQTSLEGDSAFPTELINRLDVIVPFAPLTAQVREGIAKKQLAELRQEVFDKTEVVVSFDSKVLEYLVYENSGNDTNRSNGRSIKRQIDAEIASEIAIFIDNNPTTKRVAVGVKGRLVYNDTTHAISTAEIEVGPLRETAMF